MGFVSCLVMLWKRLCILVVAFMQFLILHALVILKCTNTLGGEKCRGCTEFYL